MRLHPLFSFYIISCQRTSRLRVSNLVDWSQQVCRLESAGLSTGVDNRFKPLLSLRSAMVFNEKCRGLQSLVVDQ